MGNDIRLATLVALLGAMTAAQALDRDSEPGAALPPPTEHKAPQTPLPEFSQLDRDGDGSISEQEASVHPGLAALFAELDQNHNKRLSMREFAEARIRLGKLPKPQA